MTVDQTIKLLDKVLKPRDRLGRKGKKELIAQVEASEFINITKDNIVQILEQSADREDDLLNQISAALSDAGLASPLAAGSLPEQQELEIETKHELEEEVRALKSDIGERDELIIALEREQKDQEAKFEDMSLQLQSQADENKDQLIKTLEGKLALVSDHETLQSSFDELSNKRDATLGEVSRLTQQQDGLEEAVASLKSKLTSSVSEFRTKVLDVIPFFEILNTVSSTTAEARWQEPEWENLEEPVDPIAFIADRIKNQKFSVEEDAYARAVAAVLISNRFVSFYSPPGSGKTALARVLSRSVSGNLGADHFVPVGRGWSNPQDFIGYKNPFTNNFDYAADFWRELSHKTADTGPVRSLVFDEATLSPLEHYLSDFLSFDCLPAGEIREILVQGQRFYIPATTRFIFTFNFDASTEEITERFIDRTPVVPRANPSDPGNLDEINIDNTMSPISSKYLNDFILKQNEEARISTSDLREEFEDELDLWRSIPNFNLSSRKIKQINIFFQLMRDDEDEEYVRDFAARTFLLPLIRGYGQEYGEALATLQQATNLRRTKKRLSELVKNGKPSSNYRYV
jgi:hypothetical protein